MSLNHIYDNGVYKPYLNESCNQLLLQASSNQLKFQAAEAGFYSVVNSTAPAQNSVISIPDPGVASASFQLSVSGSSETKTRVLTIADSGKTLLINSAAAASTYTLPAPSAGVGMHFKFVVCGTLSNAATILSTGLNVNGSVVYSDAKSATAILAQTSQLKITLTSSSAIGDVVDVWSNGTIYIFSAQVAVAATITFGTS